MRDAASPLRGASLPDMLEGACRLGAASHDLGEMRRDLGQVVHAWHDQAGGRCTSPVASEDRALVDHGPHTKWHGAGAGAESTIDHPLYLMTAIKSTHAIACEALPSTRPSAPCWRR